jgi:hypothetical protein
VPLSNYKITLGEGSNKITLGEGSIAACNGVATCNRTKHPHIARAMATRQREDLLSALPNMVER